MSFYLVAGQSPATDPAPCGVHLPTRRPRRYPSDTTDVEWEIMAPYIPVGGTVPGRGGQPVTYPRRDIIDATLTRMHDGLRTQLRQALGRNAQPTATAADSQSVRAAETVARASRGYDAGKRVNGRKRHIVVDTCGLLLVVLVTGAGVQDRDAARLLLWALRTCFPGIAKVWSDGGYAGQLVNWTGATLKLSVEIVR